jgi:carbamoyl-phosphate synthase large subunit
MNIAVTGLNATDNPGPGVPIIRSIKEGDKSIRITGLLYDSLEPGIYMENIADKSYLIPYPSTGLENLYERLMVIHEKEKLDMIIPSLDSELYAFSRLSSRLLEKGIKTFLPTLRQLDIRAKDKLHNFFKDDINVPKNFLASSVSDLYNYQDDFTYPLYVKGIFYDAYKANNFEEVRSYFNKISVQWGYPVIIQESIQGEEYNVVALGDGTGKTIGAVPMRKLYITDKGKGWSGISINDPKLMELAHFILKKTEWKSGLELEFVKSKENGEFYLLEINPRFPAWVYLAVASGQNLPYYQVKLAMGEDIPIVTDYEVGKIFVRCSWDLITDISKFEQIAVKGEFEL